MKKTVIMKFYFLCAMFMILVIPICQGFTVHIFSDSHGLAYSNICGCSVNWLGPRTMFRIGRDQLEFLDLRNFNIVENDTALFIFGEIDVRCHIGKFQHTKGCSLDEIIIPLVNKYLNAIVTNRSFFNKINCIVAAVIPPVNHVSNVEYPIYGNLSERVIITKALNSYLKKACQRYDILLLDVNDHYSMPDGSLQKELSDDSVHIAQPHNNALRVELDRLLQKIYPYQSRPLVLNVCPRNVIIRSEFAMLSRNQLAQLELAEWDHAFPDIFKKKGTQ